MSLPISLRDRLLSIFPGVLDPFERRVIREMREQQKLLFLSELIPVLRGTKLFAFGTGGSISNLEGVDRLKDYNVISVSLGPLYTYRTYGFMPNIWFLHYGPSALATLDEESETPLDFSETFVLVPANDSRSVVFFSSPAVRKFRQRHPEATFVLYREIRDWELPAELASTYLQTGVEPLRTLGGGTLESIMIPLSGFWDVDTIYFSGIDHMDTGHFWDRNRPYQTMKGKPIPFPDQELSQDAARTAQAACEQKGMNVYRLEKEETILLNYPYLEFDSALADATPRITPDDFRSP